jgi:hypothetical protein
MLAAVFLMLYWYPLVELRLRSNLRAAGIQKVPKKSWSPTSLHERVAGWAKRLSLPVPNAIDRRAVSEAILKASKAGNLAHVEAWLRTGVNINYRGQHVQTSALMEAARYGHPDLIKFLVTQGAYLAAEDRYGNSPMRWAAKNNDRMTADLLVSLGAEHDIFTLSALGMRDQTATLISDDPGLVDKQLAGWMPLHVAAGNSRLETIKILVREGADIEAMDLSRATPLRRALDHGRKDSFQLLLDLGANLHATGDDGRSVLEAARQKGFKLASAHPHLLETDEVESANSESWTLRLVDEEGGVVADAVVGTIVTKRTDKNPHVGFRFSRRPIAPYSVSDAHGEASLQRSLVDIWNKPKHVYPLFAWHRSRRLAGLAELSTEDLGKTISVVMRPACRVRFKAGCSGLERVGRPLKWSHCLVTWNSLSPTLYEQDGGDNDHQFEFYLPPGEYDFLPYGSSDSDAYRTGWEPLSVTVPPGKSELDLGTIDMPIHGYCLLYDKPAPELTKITSWHFGEGVRLSDLRGKVVLLDFRMNTYRRLTGKDKLVEVFIEHKDHDLVVIQVYSVDSMQDFDRSVAKLQAILGPEWSPPFPVATNLRDEPVPFPHKYGDVKFGATWIAYGMPEYPSVFLIDRQGTLVARLDPRHDEFRESVRRICGHSTAKEALSE